MNKLTEKQISYHAAAMDGEGCITINRASENENYYQLACFVSNTNMSFLLFLKQTSGIGEIFPKNDKRRNVKKSYNWCLRKYEMKSYLETIINDLIIKKQQASLMLEFLPLMHNKFGIHNIPSNDNLILRSVIYDEIKELNKRGSRD